MDLFKEKYSSPKYNIPYGKNLSKEESKYFKSFAEGIYAYYCQGKTGISPEDVAEWQVLRQYGEGSQPESLYMNLLMGLPDTELPSGTVTTDVDTDLVQEKERTRRGYMNLLFDIVSPADKLINALCGKLGRISPEIRIDTVDPDSIDKRETEKYSIIRYLENKDFEDLYAYMSGIPVPKPDMDVMPEDRQEVEIMDMEGNIRLPYAIAMEQISLATMRLSDWEGIYEQMRRDMINLNTAGCYPYYDESSNTVRIGYLDPEEIIIQYSKFWDFRDSEFGGRFQRVQMNELVEKGVVTGVEEIRKFAQTYQGQLGNPSAINVNPSQDIANQLGYEYDDFKVMVLKCYWMDLDTKKDVIIVNRYGNKTIRPYEGQEISKKASIRETKIRKLYNCSWVIGSEFVYDYGVFEDMVRKNKNEVNFPMMIVKRPGRSITKQTRPFYDGLMLNWLRYQDAVATARKRGYAIDYNAIVNLKTGGGKNPEREVLKRLFQTGVIIFKPTNPSGRPNTYQKPIYDIGGGLAGELQEYIASFQFNTQMIESITGINPLVLGGGTEKNVSLGSQEISVAGTDNTLQPIVSSYVAIMRKVFDYVVDWVQLLLKYNQAAEDAYCGIVGKRNVDVLKEAQANNARYGTFITPSVNDFNKQEILTSAQTALASGRNGQPGITEADYVKIIDGLETGRSLKLIWLQLDRSIKKSKAEALRSARETVILDREKTGQINKEKMQMEDIMEQKKHANTKELSMLVHTQKMEELEFERGTEVLVATTKTSQNQLQKV